MWLGNERLLGIQDGKLFVGQPGQGLGSAFCQGLAYLCAELGEFDV